MATVTVSLWFTPDESWHFAGMPLWPEKDLPMFASSLRERAPVAENDTSPHLDAEGLDVVLALGGSDSAICSALSVTPAPYPASMSEDEVALAMACRMLQFIRLAREFFPAMRDLADHPGWEIVLHVFIAGREGRTVTTTDLCEKTGTWRPLAIRYTEMLFERGLLDRDISAEKPDAWALSLTPSTEARLKELLCGFSRGFVSREEGPQGLSAAN